jgi:hypothetical protein
MNLNVMTAFWHSHGTGSVTIVKAPYYRVSVIPGLTRGSTGSPP